jgi:hypothetical protein
MTQRTAGAHKAYRNDFPIAHGSHHSLRHHIVTLRFLAAILALLTTPPGDRPGVHCLTLLKAVVAQLGLLYVIAIKVHDEAYRYTWVPNIPSWPKSCGQSLRHASKIRLLAPGNVVTTCVMPTQLCLLALLPFLTHLVHFGRSTSDTWAARS